jgi:hypothetical protein
MGYGNTADCEEASFDKAMGVISKTCAIQTNLLVKLSPGMAIPFKAISIAFYGGELIFEGLRAL